MLYNKNYYYLCNMDIISTYDKTGMIIINSGQSNFLGKELGDWTGLTTLSHLGSHFIDDKTLTKEERIINIKKIEI